MLIMMNNPAKTIVLLKRYFSAPRLAKLKPLPPEPPKALPKPSWLCWSRMASTSNAAMITCNQGKILARINIGHQYSR